MGARALAVTLAKAPEAMASCMVAVASTSPEAASWGGEDGDGFGLVSEDVAEGVDAVDADIGDGAAAGEGGVGDPLARCERAGVGVERVGEQRGADAAGGDLLAEIVEGAVEAEVLADAEEEPGGLGGFVHCAGLAGVHGERLFAQDGFAVAEGEQGVFEVVGVGAGDEDGVDVG